VYIEASSVVKARAIEFIEKYGDKGLIVLKTAVELSYENSSRLKKMGDFSYSQLVMRLRSSGINYNPSNLLRILEKEYGLIYKSYESSTQKWYSFVDLDAVKDALDEYMGHPTALEDPKITYMRIKYRSLEPIRMLKLLRSMALKSSLTKNDKKLFKKMVFNDLKHVVEILDEMSEYMDIFSNEIKILNEILLLANTISSKLEREKNVPRYHSKDYVEERLSLTC